MELKISRTSIHFLLTNGVEQLQVTGEAKMCTIWLCAPSTANDNSEWVELSLVLYLAIH